ncbi:serine/threonine protein kinase [Planctomycetota bacterium]
MQIPTVPGRQDRLIEEFYPAPIARVHAGALLALDDDGSDFARQRADAVIRYVAVVVLRELVAASASRSSSALDHLETIKEPIPQGACWELLHYALKTTRSAATGSTTDGFLPLASLADPALDDWLKRLIDVRNELAEASKKARVELATQLDEVLSVVLWHLVPVRLQRLFVPRRLDDQIGDISRYTAKLYRGTGPWPEVRVLSEAPLKLGQPYLSTEGGALPLLFYPFALETACHLCGGEPELFLFTHHTKERVWGEAPATGHPLPEEAGTEARSAFSKLLQGAEQESPRTRPGRFRLECDPAPVGYPLKVGRVVRDRYMIKRVLRSGGNADIYLGEDRKQKRPVVVKALPVELSHVPEAEERISAKFKVAKELHHPNLLEHMDCGAASHQHYLVFEPANGWPLGQGEAKTRARDLKTLLLKQRDSLTMAERVRIALVVGTSVGEGLLTLHEQGVTHGELSLGHILLFESDGKKSAKIAGMDVGWKGLSSWKHREDAVSKLFAPPEAETVEGPPGRGADVYALGATLYTILSGLPPERGVDPPETWNPHPVGEPSWLGHKVAEAPLGLSRIVMKCLRKAPFDRYGGLKQVLSDLRHVAADENADPVAEAEPSRSALAPGLQLGDLTLEREIGRDDERALYLATDASTGAQRLVGVLQQSLCADNDAIGAALSRLKSLQQISHPGLLRIHDLGTQEGFTYYTTEAPKGMSLQELPALPEERAIRIVIGLAGAVHALEQAGLNHGRIRASQVFVADAETREASAQLGVIRLGGPKSDGASDNVDLAAVLQHLVQSGAPTEAGAADHTKTDLRRLLERVRRGACVNGQAFARALEELLRQRLLRRRLKQLAAICAVALVAAGGWFLKGGDLWDRGPDPAENPATRPLTQAEPTGVGTPVAALAPAAPAPRVEVVWQRVGDKQELAIRLLGSNSITVSAKDASAAKLVELLRDRRDKLASRHGAPPTRIEVRAPRDVDFDKVVAPIVVAAVRAGYKQQEIDYQPTQDSSTIAVQLSLTEDGQSTRAVIELGGTDPVTIEDSANATKKLVSMLSALRKDVLARRRSPTLQISAPTEVSFDGSVAPIMRAAFKAGFGIDEVLYTPRAE